VTTIMLPLERTTIVRLFTRSAGHEDVTDRTALTEGLLG
jgi:hypothetical protein